MSAWKDLERRIARALGGERSGPLGKHGSDAQGTRFSVECKRTTRYQLRQAWIAQARRQSKQEGKPWLLIVSEHNDKRPVVVLDFWAFAEIAQRAGLIPAPVEVSDDPTNAALTGTEPARVTLTLAGRHEQEVANASRAPRSSYKRGTLKPPAQPKLCTVCWNVLKLVGTAWVCPKGHEVKT